MATNVHPVAVAVQLDDAFNRRDLPGFIALLHRTVEISNADGDMALGHPGARWFLQGADSNGTGRYIRRSHYVCTGGTVSGALEVELRDHGSGDVLARSHLVVTLECAAGRVRALDLRRSEREEMIRASEVSL
jgi:hypothetical protein